MRQRHQNTTLFPYTTLFRSAIIKNTSPPNQKEAFLMETTYKGTNKLITGIVFGVISFWLFAQSMVNIVPAVQSDLRSEEHTSELQSRENLVCRLLLEKKKNT